MTEAAHSTPCWRDLATPIGTIRIEVQELHLTSISWPELTASCATPQAPMGQGDTPEAVALLDEAARQLEEYFAGRRRSFDLPLRSPGTPFQERVWRTLAEVPYGGTWSYQQLARTAGLFRAVRAVAQAVAANPLPILVPCHRIVRSDGHLGGYAGGRARKRWLLDLERHGAL